MNHQKAPVLTEEALKTLVPLRPKQDGDTETAWADPWTATAEDMEVVRGRLITNAINSEPDEIERLEQARKDARAGRREPRRSDSSCS